MYVSFNLFLYIHCIYYPIFCDFAFSIIYGTFRMKQYFLILKVILFFSRIVLVSLIVLNPDFGFEIYFLERIMRKFSRTHFHLDQISYENRLGGLLV